MTVCSALKALMVSALALPFTAAALPVSPAWAKRVSISGTHTRAEFKSKCTAGMDYYSNAGGFGCENRSKGTGVYCTVKGKCTGLVPDRRAPQLPRRPTLGGVLKVSR